MPKVIGAESDQGSNAWLEYRRFHIMSTDAAPIMNESRWKTQEDIWKEKRGDTMPEPSKASKEAMERGTRLEPCARDLFIERHGVVTPCVYQSDLYPWMATSLDGISEWECKRHFIEIKCPTKSHYHEMAKKGEMSFIYFCQIQHHFLCTGCELGYFVSYFPEDLENEYVEFEVRPSRDFIDRLLANELEFWEKLCKFEEPIWRLK
jgi:putative phage-type endonuclease